MSWGKSVLSPHHCKSRNQYKIKWAKAQYVSKHTVKTLGRMTTLSRTQHIAFASTVLCYVILLPKTAPQLCSNIQEAQLSPRDRAMRRVNWNLASCHATVQKLLIWQVLTKSIVWCWRFSRRECMIDNVHSTMMWPSRLPLSQVS